MSTLTIRRLLIDLESPVSRHWFAGDPFRTAFFNALSMSFPVGEQFFIDSVRQGLAALPREAQAQWRGEVQGFIGQEATHRHIHALFNAQIEKHGLHNDWAPRARERLKQLEGLDPRHALGVTAANEHFTAILAEWLLGHPDLLQAVEPRLQTLWLWHSAEEVEHKSTAFDLYRALGGNEAWRRIWFRRVTLIFLLDTLRQTLHNLKRDRTLWRWHTFMSALQFFFSRTGLVRKTFKPWRAYLRPDFHPSQLGSPLSEHWLQANAAQFALIDRPVKPSLRC